MKDLRKISLRQGYQHAKKMLYTSLMLAGLALPLPAQVKTTELEDFNDGLLNKSSVEEHPAKWEVKNQRLEAQDFDEAWGDGKVSGTTRDLVNDKLYPFNDAYEMSLEVTINASAWGSESDRRGVVFAGDPIGGTYHVLNINAHPNKTPQIWVERQSPGFSGPNESYVNMETNLLNAGGSNTLKITYAKATKYDIFLNGTELTAISPVDPETGNTVDYIDQIPLLAGYIGFHIYDSMGAGDPLFSSTTYFDNLAVTYNAGGGGAQVIQKGLEGALQPHIPELFMRGDSNRDHKVDISDPVHTLQYLFLNGSGSCLDAMDANDDGDIDISDPIKSLFHLFIGGTKYWLPPPNLGQNEQGIIIPNAKEGMDLTYDNLRCSDGNNP